MITTNNVLRAKLKTEGCVWCALYRMLSPSVAVNMTQQYGYGYGYQAYGYGQPAAPAAGYMGYAATAVRPAYTPPPHVPPAPQQQGVGYSPYAANATPTNQTQGAL